MSYGERTRNPHEHDDTAEDNPLYCRSCGGYLCQYEEATPDKVQFYNGWSYCVDHAEEMRRLERSPDPVNEVRR